MTAKDRFWLKVRITPSCWLWTGSTNRGGYGRFEVDGKSRYVHRLAHEWLVGPIPSGLHIDHVRSRGCRHRNCVNPAHLEPVTHTENVRRGDGGARCANKTHCPAGHPYDTDNTYRFRNCRQCRECARLRAINRRAVTS